MTQEEKKAPRKRGKTAKEMREAIAKMQEKLEAQETKEIKKLWNAWGEIVKLLNAEYEGGFKKNYKFNFTPERMKYLVNDVMLKNVALHLTEWQKQDLEEKQKRQQEKNNA